MVKSFRPLNHSLVFTDGIEQRMQRSCCILGFAPWFDFMGYMVSLACKSLHFQGLRCRVGLLNPHALWHLTLLAKEDASILSFQS